MDLEAPNNTSSRQPDQCNMHRLNLSALACFLTRLNSRPWSPLPTDATQNISMAISSLIDTLLLACAKSHMLSASRQQPHLLHVSAVDRRQAKYSRLRLFNLGGMSCFNRNNAVQ